jgi:tetratricopeptide (TPR) repeat protein
LANIDKALADYPSARASYQQALPIYQKIQQRLGEANCIQGMGDIDKALADYPSARASYQQALSIYQQIKQRLGEANCILGLGDIDKALDDYPSARASYQQAGNIYEEISHKRSQANCFNSTATLYQRQKQFELALIAFKQAIEIFPNEESWYQNRASLYMQMENYPKAEADIKQTEALGTNTAYTLLRKAELALWQQQTSPAVELNQQALAQRPADGHFRAFFALTLLANQQTQRANTEMQPALTALYQQHDFEDLLEDLDKLNRIYGHQAESENLREMITTRQQAMNRKIQ